MARALGKGSELLKLHATELLQTKNLEVISKKKVEEWGCLG